MKKSVKCIIAGGIIAIAGAGLFATTLAYGATGYSSRFLTIGFDRDDREFEIGFHDDDYDDWYHRDNAESSYINWDFSQYASSETSPNVESSASVPDDNAASSAPANPSDLSAADIQSLLIDVNSAAVSVRIGTSFDIESRGVSDLSWSHDQSNGTVRIDSDEKVERFDDDSRWVRITIPRDAVLTSFGAQIERGELDLHNLSVQDLAAYLGSGDIDIEYADVVNAALETGTGDIGFENGTADNLSMIIGAGEGDLETSTVGSLSAMIGAGDFDGSGTLQNFSVITGVGDIEMSVNGSASDYYVALETGLGTIQTPSGTSRGSTTLGSEGAVYTGTVQTGTGAIEFRFR